MFWHWFIARVNVAAAEVVGDVAPTIVVVGVVNEGIYFPVDITAGIDHVKICYPAFQSPGCDIKIIDVVLWVQIFVSLSRRRLGSIKNEPSTSISCDMC